MCGEVRLPDGEVCEDCVENECAIDGCVGTGVVSAFGGVGVYCQGHAIREGRKLTWEYLEREDKVVMYESWTFNDGLRKKPRKRFSNEEQYKWKLGAEYRYHKMWMGVIEKWLKLVRTEVGVMFPEDYEEVPFWVR